MIPVEGATGWADTTMMHAEAPHPNCAYKWMEWTLSSNLQGDLASWFGSVPVVLDGLQQERAARTRGLQDQWPRQLRADPLLADAGRASAPTQGECVPYYRWVTDYIAVLGGR